jgi:protein-tyrosine phosphatase
MGDQPGFSIVHSALRVMEYIDRLSDDYKVLIHCRGGRSRSVALAIAIIMWKQGLDEMQALKIVQSKH